MFNTGFARWIVTLTALWCSAPAAHGAVEYYVSPKGADANAGTRQQPFATLDRARAAVSQRTARNEPVHVYLDSGTYYLPDTLIFQAADSGTKDAPVTYAPAPGAQVIISGGQKLSLAWTPYKDGIMQAKVPDGLTADQLFVNGQRQIMARYPNYDPAAAQFNGSAADAFSPARAARWADPAGGYMHAMHASLWGDYSWQITGKDAQNNLTYVGGWQNNRPGPMHRQYRFVENIFEELDAPNEWFLNTKTATLYYYPPKDVKIDSATVETVRLRHLVEFRGTQKEPVRFITLRGFTFRQAARTFMDNKEPLLRSDWTTYRGGAIFFNGAEDCALESSTIDQVGGNAVFVNKYNRRIAIRNSIISEAGGNGVAFVGGPDAVRSPLFRYENVQDLSKIDRTPGPKTDNYPADCLVDDCLIYRTGRVEKQTAPIQISMSMGITVRHCSIFDVPRAGINICDGCWGGDVIEFCDVFDTVKETGDHGSFNSWGRDRFWRPSIAEVSTLVAANPDLPLLDCIKPIILRNTRWRCDHGWDIDLDDGSTNYQIYNNLCLNGGLKNREGFDRVVENNILAGNRAGTFYAHVWYNGSKDIFRKNILFTAYKPTGMPRGPWGTDFDFNLLQTPGLAPASPAAALQRASGRDEHSVLADALFTDPAKGDYRVKENSPALAQGFKNFPMDQFGVTDPKLKALARTPFSSPAQVNAIQAIARDEKPRDFLGATIKNIAGMGEVSAYGLSGETGALLTLVPPASAAAAAGLKERDVILGCGDKPVDTVDDLLTSAAVAKGAKIKLDVWRLQQHVSLEVPAGTTFP